MSRKTRSIEALDVAEGYVAEARFSIERVELQLDRNVRNLNAAQQLAIVEKLLMQLDHTLMKAQEELEVPANLLPRMRS